jgi:hypothetical protein
MDIYDDVVNLERLMRDEADECAHEKKLALIAKMESTRGKRATQAIIEAINAVHNRPLARAE